MIYNYTVKITNFIHLFIFSYDVNYYKATCADKYPIKTKATVFVNSFPVVLIAVMTKFVLNQL